MADEQPVVLVPVDRAESLASVEGAFVTEVTVSKVDESRNVDIDVDMNDRGTLNKKEGLILAEDTSESITSEPVFDQGIFKSLDTSFSDEDVDSNAETEVSDNEEEAEISSGSEGEVNNDDVETEVSEDNNDDGNNESHCEGDEKQKNDENIAVSTENSEPPMDGNGKEDEYRTQELNPNEMVPNSNSNENSPKDFVEGRAICDALEALDGKGSPIKSGEQKTDGTEIEVLNSTPELTSALIMQDATTTEPEPLRNAEQRISASVPTEYPIPNCDDSKNQSDATVFSEKVDISLKYAASVDDLNSTKSVDSKTANLEDANNVIVIIQKDKNELDINQGLAMDIEGPPDGETSDKKRTEENQGDEELTREEAMDGAGEGQGEAVDVDGGHADGFSGENPEVISKENPEVISKENPEVISKENPEVISKENPEVISKENPEVISKENPEVISKENPEVISKENPEVISKENPEVISKENPEVISKENPEVISKENPEVISKENPEVISKENPEVISKENPEGFSGENAKGFSEENAEGFSEENAKGFSEENAKGFSEENAKGFSEENAKGFSEENAKGFSEENAKGFSEENPEGVSETNPEGVLEENPEGFSGENAEGFSEENPEGFNEENPEGFNEENPEGFNEENPEGFNEENPEGFNEENPEGFNEENPETFSGENAEGFSGENPEGFTEENPGGFSEGYPEGETTGEDYAEGDYSVDQQYYEEGGAYDEEFVGEADGIDAETGVESMEIEGNEKVTEISNLDASVLEVSIHADPNHVEPELIDITEDDKAEPDTQENSDIEVLLEIPVSAKESPLVPVVPVVPAPAASQIPCLINGKVELKVPKGNQSLPVVKEKEKMTVLYSNPDVYLYSIPTGVEKDRHKAADWDLSNPIMTGTLTVLSPSSPAISSFSCKLELADEDGDPYGYTFIDKYPGEMLNRTTDSTRYFYLKHIKINSHYSKPDEEEIVGMGFVDRNESFRFSQVIENCLKAQQKITNSSSIQTAIKRPKPPPQEVPVFKKPKVNGIPAPAIGSSKKRVEKASKVTAPTPTVVAVVEPVKKKTFVLTEENKAQFLKRGLPDASGLFTCHLCPASFDDMRHIKSHWHTIHHLRHPAHCVVCKTPFPSAEKMTAHRSQAHGFKCPQSGCGKVFKLSSSLTAHYLAVHKKKLEFPCNLCDQRCPSTAALKVHLDDKHRNADGTSRLFDCPHVGCGEKLFSEPELVNHVVCHQKFIKCQLCEDRFSTKGDLRKHYEEEHGWTKEIRV